MALPIRRSAAKEEARSDTKIKNRRHDWAQGEAYVTGSVQKMSVRTRLRSYYLSRITVTRKEQTGVIRSFGKINYADLNAPFRIVVDGFNGDIN